MKKIQVTMTQAEFNEALQLLAQTTGKPVSADYVTEYLQSTIRQSLRHELRWLREKAAVCGWTVDPRVSAGA